MRALLALSLSAAVLSGCLTSQENPNYEHSTTYRGDNPGQNQYASAPIAGSQYSGSQYSGTQYAGGSAPTSSVSIDSPEAQAIFASTGATDPSFVASPSIAAPQTILATAPTDAAYGAVEVSGTPGFMALQNAQQAPSLQAVAPALPAAQIVETAPIGASGTPIDYDYSRNIIAVDAVTTHQQLPETVRTIQGAGQNYTVQPGDTVYGLSRKTCVGVNVIQSMNGLSPDYGIKIGQTLTLPQSVC